MRKEMWSIGFVCALGAFIGTLVALEIATRFMYGSWFWGIGALVGGLVAYCAVDFRHFCAGVARSYRRTINWHPDYAWWKAYGICFCGFYTICVSSILLTTVAIKPDNFIIMPLIAFAVVSATLTLVLLANCPENDCEIRSSSLQMATEIGWNGIRNFNPIAIVYWIFWSIWWVVRRIPSATKTTYQATKRETKLMTTNIKQFAVGAFIYVHTERRKICFVAATIGATLGYFFDSAIFGTTMGAILGAIEYEVVSIRWLKLVPAKAK